MKNHRPAHSSRIILILFLCLCICQNALAGVLTLPAGTKAIEEEAFYGDQNIDEVVLPEGVEEIGPRAFADSGLKKINLPSSLKKDSISLSAIGQDVEITADKESEAYEWAIENGYTVAEEHPEFAPEISDVYGQITKVKNYNEQLMYVEFKCKYLAYPDGTTNQARKNMKIYFGATEDQTDAELLNANSVGIGQSGDDFNINFSRHLNGYTGSAYYLWIEADNGIGQDSYGPYQIKVISRDREGEQGLLFRKISETTCSLDYISNSIERINGNYSIPSTDEDGRSVIQIDSGFDRQYFQKLLIPDTVQTIRGIWECEELEEVALPVSVKYISSYAFSDALKLEKIHCFPYSYAWMWFTKKGFADKLIEWDGKTDPFVTEEVIHPEWYTFSDHGDGTCILSSYVGPDENWQDIIIPAAADGKKVIGIGENAFAEKTSLSGRLVIPDGIEFIGNRAFYRCLGLRGELVIPDSVVSIGEDAFNQCSNLKGLKLSANLQEIGPSAFAYLNSLEGDLIIPEGLTKIESNAFSNCGAIYNVSGKLVLPEGLLEIGSYAFCWCGLAGNLVIPEGVTKIGSGAFASAERFTGPLWLPDSIETLEQSAFANCSGFSGTLKLPASLKVIEYKTFEKCTGFTGSLIIPASVTRIANDAFLNCSGLNGNLYIPNEIYLDPAWGTSCFAFKGCDGLEQIYCKSESSAWNSLVQEGLEDKLVDWDGNYDSIPGLTDYTAWTGYLIGSHIAVYSGADSVEAGAYLDSMLVTIIGENSGRYQIRTNDGSLWWVEKRYIGTDGNQVTVTVAAEKSGQAPYAHVQGSATAAGGNTPYRYTFSLYKGNAPVLTTDLQDSGEYAFDIIQPGTYSILATATDADGKTGKAFSASFEITNRESVSVSGRVLSDTGNSLPAVSVTICEGESTAYTGLTDASGSWTWNGASAGKTYTVAYAKEGMSFGEPVSFTVEQAWNLVLEPVYAEGAGNDVWSQSQGLHGLALADDGSPMEGIPVSLTTENSTAARVTWTDFRGQWAFSGLTDGTVYTVTYGGGAVHADPESESVTFSAESSIELQTVIGSITGDESSSISFSMAPETVTVHGSVAFEIHVPDNTVAVRLVVDGKPYDVFATENGQAHLTRVFNKSGNRKVAFQISPDGTAWTEISAVKNLEVTSYGPPLDAPVIEPVAGHTTGSPLTVRWGNVTNAEEYVIYLSRNGEAVDRLTTENLFIEIPDYDFELPGSYTVLVMGTGTGYDQSEAAIVVDVVAKDYTLSITEANNCADRGVHEAINVHISQNYGYILLKVETPSGTIWYPGAGALIPDNEFSHSIETPEAGSYSITPYLYTISPLRNNSVPFMTGRTIQVSVNGPAIKTVLPGGNDWTWLTESESRTIGVTTNTGVETVSVYEGTELLGTKVYSGEVTSSGARLFTVTLDHALTAGRHTVTVKATSADGKLETAKEKQFYVVHTVTEPYTVYAQAELLELTSSPLLSARTTKIVATVCGGTNVEALTCIGEAGDFLQVRKQAETSAVPRQATGRAVTEGFAPAGSLAPTVWSGASGTLTLIKPGSDLSLPQGTHALLEVSWNCGVAVPTGSVFEISLTPLVGTSPVKVTTSAPGERISVTTLEADEYTLQVKLLQGNTVLAASETRKINIGNFSLEEAYRSWWLQHNVANYNSYLENGEPFDEKVSAWHGWGGFIPLNVRGMRPTIIFEPATLAYKQMLEDFKDLDKDAHVNTVENIHLVIQDEAQLRRTALINIAEAMLEEKEAGNLMLKEDMSNVSGVAQSNQTISVRQSWAQVIMDSIKAIISGSKIGLNIYKFSNPTFEPEPFNNCLDFIGAIADIAEDAWMGYLEEWAILYNLNASADQYATLLGKACDAYVKCLEETYLGDDWDTRGTYSSYVKEYIDKFKEMKADPDRLHEIALNQILEGTGYTPAQLLDMESECICEAASEAMMSDIGNAMVLAVNIWAKTEYNITVNILKYDDGAISINPEVGTTLINEIFQKQGKELKQELRDQLTEKMNEALKRKNKNWRKDIAEFKEKIRDVEGKLGALDCVLSSAVDAWELGVTLGELGQSASRLSEQGNNKGWFDTYGLNLVLTLKLRQEAYITGGLRSVNWDREGATISIEELEKFRNTLVSLTNYDLSILRNYHAMRLINDSNGFKFKYGLEWMTPADIQRRISLVSTYREMFLERPSVFDPLFE